MNKTKEINERIKLLRKEEGHFYKTPIGILPSVTTILSIIHKPWLEQWKLREPRWKEISDHAMDIGTKTHKIIECYLKNEAISWLWCVEIEKTFPAFISWQVDSSFEAEETEVITWSEMGYGGQIDLTGNLNGKFYIIDLKTSKQINPNYLLQLSGYRAAYEERNDRKPDGMAVLRLDKYTGGYEWKEYSETEYQRGLRMFSLLCEFYNLGEER